jgi:hypothetical protein
VPCKKFFFLAKVATIDKEVVIKVDLLEDLVKSGYKPYTK